MAVFAAIVVMAAGPEAKLVAEKANGPPNEPTVVFCSVNVAGLGVLVKVQTIVANGFKLAVGMVMTLPASVPKLAGLPVVPELVSVQLPLAMLKLLLAASVNVTAVPIFDTDM